MSTNAKIYKLHYIPEYGYDLSTVCISPSSLSDLAGRNYVHSWNDAMILWP